MARETHYFFKRERGVYKMNLWVRKGKEQVGMVSEASTSPQSTRGILDHHHNCKAYACSVCHRFNPLEEEEEIEGEYMGFTRPGTVN